MSAFKFHGKDRQRVYLRATYYTHQIASLCMFLLLLQTYWYLQSSTSPVGLQAGVSDAPSTDHNNYPELFRQTFGSGWKIWHDSDTPLPPPSPDYQCRWTRFRAFQRNDNDNLRPHSNISMCLHDTRSDIWVSRTIQLHGRWSDCDSLTFHWQRSNNSRYNTPDPTTNDWYFDIGANIGACLMQVLLTTNATIAAFEPAPGNLFHLTSTLSRLEPTLRRRVYVFPVALGSEASGQSEIHVASDNRGNAVVGQPIQDQDRPGQTFLEPMPIPVERLDDLIRVDASRDKLRLVKMDAQGYECSIMNGAGRFLQAAQTVHFEFEPLMLRAFANCNETILWNAFQGWDVYRDQMPKRGITPPARAKFRQMPKTKAGINMVAFNLQN